MAEVVIELELTRRSGVLAAAIAALRQLPVTFRSQQLVESDGQARLILTTDGEIASLLEVQDAYASTRGVAAVAAVRVDGRSLVSVEDEVTEPADVFPRADPSERGDSGAGAVPAQALPADAGEGDDRRDGAGAAGDDPSQTGFDDEVFARHVLVPTAEDASDETDQDKAKPRAGLFRRRRRLR
jgi:hypothetical protein